MGILGIENRTENYRTASYFARFIGDAGAKNRACLARCLAENDGAQLDFQPEQVELELFWKGVRDHFDEQKRLKISVGKRGKDELLATYYRQLFPDLLADIRSFAVGNRELDVSKDWNYNPSDKYIHMLGNNLLNMEIDIVLQTPSYLFIGEAKHKMPLTGDGKRVLVHQLVAQYVMATIMLKVRNLEKTVVPFVVRNRLTGQEQVQVEFMKANKWMRKGNELQWSDIENLCS